MKTLLFLGLMLTQVQLFCFAFVYLAQQAELTSGPKAILLTGLGAALLQLVVGVLAARKVKWGKKTDYTAVPFIPVNY